MLVKRTTPKEDSNNGSVDEISKSPVIFGGNHDFISKIGHCLHEYIDLNQM